MNDENLCGLKYVCPANAGWGMVRIAMQVPETYQLFISPAACGRHGALTAIQHGIKDRLSYYYVEETDIVRGYDLVIGNAVNELLKFLKTQNRNPRVITLFVTCIDDLIGTDTAALTEELEEEHPGIYFHFCHMNPISEASKVPPMAEIHRDIYSLLYKNKLEEKDTGVNLLGNLVNLSDDCELYELLDILKAGPVRHISSFQTFNDFLSMGKSMCSLVLYGPAGLAAENLEKNLGQKKISLLSSTDPIRIRERYTQMGKEIQALLTGEWKELPESFTAILDRQEKILKETARETVQELKGCPVAVDDFASTDPFELALFLLSEGINVTYVTFKEASGQTEDDMDKLKKQYPEVKIIRSTDFRIPGEIKKNAGCREESKDPLMAVGLEAAYELKADYIVDRYFDEGSFGFQGLISLLKAMKESCGKETDLKSKIEEKGLVV